MKLPKSIEILEVGPRDGFQNIKEWIPTELKLDVIEGLIQSNFKKIELTSFVHPRAIPQMKDAHDIVKFALEKYKDSTIYALVPNLRGATDAFNAGIKNVTYVISVSESHNKANVNRTVDESFEELFNLKKELPGLNIKLDLATVFGCPFLGYIPYQKVKYAIEKGLMANVEKICLCDTIGIANPLQMSDLLEKINSDFPNIDFSMHLHDTRGMGLANTLVAIEKGITEFETSVGGLGGCPFAPGAAGNLASEDLVFMLESMNINTGINLDNLMTTVKIVREKIKSDLTGHLSFVENPYGVFKTINDN